MASYDPLGPWNPPASWNPGWTYQTPIIQPGCDHCYCLPAKADPVGSVDQVTKNHLQCCKCSDRKHKKFVLYKVGGTDSGKLQ